MKTFEGADGLKTGFTNAAGFNIITSAKRNGKRVIAVTMGHKTAKERDKKVSSLMDGGLNTLVKQASITVAHNSAEKGKNYAIQLGAFSNYAKNIEIEPIQNDSVVVYRSKIIGFAQDEAQKTCYDLKKSNMSCIVVENANQSIILAQK